MWKSVAYYKALSNQKRLIILRLLKSNEKTVGEISRSLKIRQSNVSQHLMILKLAGIVQKRRDGKNIYYHLKTYK